MSATTSRPGRGADGDRAAAAASRAARSRPGSRRPAAAGRGRPRPRASSPSADSATPNSRAVASCRRDRLARRPRRGRPPRGETENSCRFIRARSSRSRTSRSSRRDSTRIVRDASSGVNAPSPSALGVAADRGQRRLQLVADREQEVPLALARDGELLRHLVERLRERGELGRALLGQRRRRLAGGERVARDRDAPHRPHDRARDQERERPPRARRPRAPRASRSPRNGCQRRPRSPAAAGARRAPGSSGTSRCTSCPGTSSCRCSTGPTSGHVLRRASARRSTIVRHAAGDDASS